MNHLSIARPSFIWPAIAVICCVFPFISPAGAHQPAPPSDASGHWEGAIELPGMALNVLVDLANDSSAGWTGTIDIPQQGAKKLPLEAVTVHGEQVRFAIKGIPGEPTFEGKLAGGKIEGTFSQGGMTAPFKLGRDKIAAPKRPQEPKPPLPYREEFITFPSGAITLAGTLTIPSGPGPFPAAVLVSGSGPQNRDEELLGHKPFLILADRLTRAGIAVLRYDDRGTGESKGDFKSATSEDFASDALSAVAFARTRKEIAPGKVGIIGHSEGGLVAPMAAARSKDVAWIVLLAGTGVRGADVLAEQNRLILRAEGATAAQAEEQSQRVRELCKVIVSGAESSKVRALVEAMVRVEMEMTPPGAAADGKPATKPSERAISAVTEQQVRAVTGKWFRYFLEYDPRTALSRVTVPVLAINGELDTQVSAKQNLPEIEKALREGGNKDVTVTALPGLNHLFQQTKTGAPSEYGRNEETFNEDALKLVADWINDRFGPSATGQ